MNDGPFVTYTNTVEGFVVWNQYHCAHSPFIRRSKAIAIWGVAAAFFVLMAVMSHVMHDRGLEPPSK